MFNLHEHEAFFCLRWYKLNYTHHCTWTLFNQNQYQYLNVDLFIILLLGEFSIFNGENE